MKAVILAGGYGTRLSEETHLIPKPMIEIGQKPILWHIMKIYSAHGINEFIICSGYKSYVIKEYFNNYILHTSDVTFDIENNKMQIHQNNSEKWKITIVDTGQNTMTGGRLKRVQKYLNNEKTFCFTYGDGLSDVNISKLIEFHKKNKKEATLIAVSLPGRFGSLKLKEDCSVSDFYEKPKSDGNWVNGGFFVLSSKIFNRIANDSISWEQEPLNSLAKDNQLIAYKHDGFWQSMDTLYEKKLLTNLWLNNKAPWKIW